MKDRNNMETVIEIFKVCFGFFTFTIFTYRKKK